MHERHPTRPARTRPPIFRHRPIAADSSVPMWHWFYLTPGKVPFRSGQQRELVAKGVQAHAAEGEGAGVELPDVERCAVPDTGVLAGRQPKAFADFVCGGLAGPAEVAVDLVGYVRRVGDGAGEHEFQAQLWRPPLAFVEPGARRDLQLEVHAEVDDHPRGA